MNLRKLLSFLCLVIVLLSSGYASIFWFSGNSALNVIYLKIIGSAIIPSVLSFGWMALWKESDEPFTFHMNWNATSQIILLGIILSQIQSRSWGLLVWGTVLLTIFLLISNYTGFSGTKNGFSVTGFLILVNVVLLFSIVLTSFNHLDIIFLIEPSFEARLLLKALINEVSVMGILLTASSQLYWHEKLKEKQESLFMEKIVNSIMNVQYFDNFFIYLHLVLS